jgi:hypothetical protein
MLQLTLDSICYICTEGKWERKQGNKITGGGKEGRSKERMKECRRVREDGRTLRKGMKWNVTYRRTV